MIRFRLHWLAAATILSSTVAQAESTYSGKQIGGLSKEWTAADSSEANRQSLKFGAFATLGAQTIGGVNYAFNPDNQLEIAYRHDRYSSDNLSERKTDVKDFIVMYRRFVGSTFVIGGGLMHRTLTLQGQEWWGGRDDATSGYCHYSDYQRDRAEYVGKFILGNQWQWKHFNVGVDWLTLEQFVGKQKDQFKSTPYLDPQNNGQRLTLQRAETNSLSETHGYDRNLKIVNPVFRLGWSF